MIFLKTKSLAYSIVKNRESIGAASHLVSRNVISGICTCTCVTRAIVRNITRDKEIGYVVLISRIQQTAPSTSRSFLSNSILLLHPVPLLTLPFSLSFVDISPCLSSCSIPFDLASRI